MADEKNRTEDMIDFYDGAGKGLTEEEGRKIGQAMTYQRFWGKRESAIKSGQETRPDLIEMQKTAYNMYIGHPCSEKGTTSYVSGIELDSCKRQAAEQLSYADMPEGMNVSDRFPAMDPEGKFCDVDMEFAQRLQLVEGLVKGRGEEVQTYVSQVLQDMDYKKPNNQSELGKMSRQMKEDCKQVRMYERAAKIATNSFQNEEASHILEERAKEMSRSKSVKDYENALTAMEYLCGVKQGKVPQDIQNYMSEMGRPMDQELVNEGMKADAGPKILPITFNNLGNQLRQNYFARPGHWNLPVPSVEKLDTGLAQHAAKGPKQKAAVERTMDTITGRYAEKTVGAMLDAKFQAYEERFDLMNIGDMDRSHLITINGKRACDLMLEEYQKSPELQEKYRTFHQWNLENGKNFVNQHVASALMGGARVEAFLPDENGEIKEPTEITKQGYSPSPVEKVTMNHWQRTWAKYGHYQKLAAKMELYKNTMESREIILKEARFGKGRESKSPISTVQRETFLGFRDKSKLPSSGQFKATDRAGAVTACMCMMLEQGKTVSEMADFNCLQEEKRAIGAEYMEHYTRDLNAQRAWASGPNAANPRPLSEDGKWLAGRFVNGQMIVLQELDELGKQGKLCDPEWIKENQQYLTIANGILHDTSQNCDSIKAAYKELAGQYYPDKKDPGAFLQGRLENYTTYFNVINKGFRCEMETSKKANDVWDAVAAVATRDWLLKEAANQLKQHPDKPFGEMLNEDMNIAAGNVNNIASTFMMDKEKRAIKNQLEQDPKMVDTLLRYLHMGKIDKLMNVDVKLEKDSAFPDVKLNLNEKVREKAWKKTDSRQKISQSLQKTQDKAAQKAQKAQEAKQAKQAKQDKKAKPAKQAGGRTR